MIKIRIVFIIFMNGIVVGFNEILVEVIKVDLEIVVSILYNFVK